MMPLCLFKYFTGTVILLAVNNFLMPHCFSPDNYSLLCCNLTSFQARDQSLSLFIPPEFRILVKNTLCCLKWMTALEPRFQTTSSEKCFNKASAL